MAKVLVSIDDRLLQRIDKEAAARRVTRSALLSELAARGLGPALGPGAEVHEALADLDALAAEAEAAGELPYGDTTADIRAMRDERWG
jgi:hypothetical protein